MDEPWLVVAVCTNRPLRLIAPTLDALAGQLRSAEGTAGLLVASGVHDARWAELSGHARNLGMRTERAIPPGLSIARNAAVEQAEGAEVVAFIDDDALPDPDWLTRLADHWRGAPEDLGCIGGAIDPLWVDPPPRWMSERIHIVFSLLDRGDGVVPLVPGREDAWGVNVSFRVSALETAGGFDPRLGPVEGIPFFADETEVQRRLAQGGCRGIYAGDVRVAHAVTKERMTLREVFRRRYYAGASMRLTGQWGVGGGMARLVGGAASIPIAVLRRRPEDMAVGIARAGAGLGVLAAPRVRARIARRFTAPGTRPGVTERIALMHSFDPREVRRGTERLLEELAGGLHTDGRSATVVVAHSGPRREEERDGIPFVVNRRSPAPGPLRRHALAHVPAAWRTLREGGFDLAHAFHPADGLAAVAWGRRSGGATVLTVPAFPPAGGGVLRLRVLRKAFSADAIVVPTRAVEAAVLRAFPMAATRLIAPGVDTERFRLGGGRSEHPMVFCAADLGEPRKGVEMLARAFTAARVELPEARLVLAHPYENEPPGWARAPGIEILPVANDADLIAAYREAWVSALPARDEPFGLVLTESMACGTPVLGADDGGIPEVIGTGPQGRVVATSDEAAWTAALREALASPPGAPAVDAARERAELFSMRACVSGYEEVYDTLLAGSA